MEYKNKKDIGSLVQAMIAYDQGDPGRVQHFMKVYAFAKAIGEQEGLPERTQQILEAAAVVHDIGIRLSEEKYHASSGRYQELEGPPEAKKLLEGLGYDAEFIRRVCFLVGHHHTYHQIDGPDYQILVEADFLVNIYEEQMTPKQIERICDTCFATKTGKSFLECMFLHDATKKQ